VDQERLGQGSDLGSRPGTSRYVLLLQKDISSGARSVETGGILLGIKRWGEDGHSPRYSVEVKNKWSCTFPPPVHLHGRHNDKVAATFSKFLVRGAVFKKSYLFILEAYSNLGLHCTDRTLLTYLLTYSMEQSPS